MSDLTIICQLNVQPAKVLYMDSYDLKLKTKLFVIDTIKYLKSLRGDFIEEIIARQLLRSSTSMAANYRAACRSRSKREFFSKLSIVVEETDETMFWLEILIESGISDNKSSNGLFERSSEFIRIFSKARKTTGKDLNK